VVTVRAADTDAVVARLKAAGVPVRRIGQTSGAALTLPGERPLALKSLNERFEGWLPSYMAGGLVRE
jgi:phosphoribosylformylglycinamidine synthase